MVSKTSIPPTDAWPGRRLDHAAFAVTLAERRAALGDPVMPRNSGTRRTASKRALLKAIEDVGGEW